MPVDSGRAPPELEALAPAARTRWRLLAGAAALTVMCVSLLPEPPLAIEPPRDSDKLIHAAMYAALAWLHGRAYPHARPLVLAALLTAYGGGIELVQGLTPHRSASWADALANAFGASIMLACLARRRRRRAAPLEADGTP